MNRPTSKSSGADAARQVEPSRLLVGGDLVLYGDVGDLWGDGSGFSAADVLDALAEYGKGPLNVRINSAGGSAFDGVAIFNALERHDGAITVHVDGLAASAASVIAMAGDEIVMGRGAMIMIHDPSALIAGNPDALRAAAGTLDGLADTVAQIYATRTGMPADQVRNLMKAETWMDADQAVAAGFATAIAADAPTMAAPAFDFTLYRHPPTRIAAAAMRALPPDLKETIMSASASPDAAPVADKPAPTMSARMAASIARQCADAKLTAAETATVLETAYNTETAKTAIVDMWARRDPDYGRPIYPAMVVDDQRDRFATGAQKALAARLGLSGGERNEYSGMSIAELARMSVEVRGGGRAIMGGGPAKWLDAAFRMDGGGAHSTSDFGNILASTMNRQLLESYRAAQSPIVQFLARPGQLRDFRVGYRNRLGEAAKPEKVLEGAMITYGTRSDVAPETIQLATYAKLFAITRQALINDDLNAFSDQLGDMGRSAAQQMADTVVGLLTANTNAGATMADGYALFSSQHSNVAGSGGAITVGSLDVARAAIRNTVGIDGVTYLGLEPRYLVVGTAQETTALMYTSSLYASSPANTNPFANKLEVLVDPRISGNNWYLFTDPAQAPILELAGLNGPPVPQLEQQLGWEMLGTQFRCYVDYGAAVIGYRGAYRNPGA